MKKTITLIAAFVSMNLSAQISSKFYGEVEEIKQLKERVLVVETLEEDNKIITKLSKKKDDSKLIEYKQKIAEINEKLKEYALKDWTLNKKIEFKTTTEIEALRLKKVTDYALLRHFEIGDAHNFEKGKAGQMYVPALAYTRLENKPEKPDTRFYIPESFSSTDKNYADYSYKLSVNLFQKHINWIIENNKIEFLYDYCEAEAIKNCEKLKTKKLLVKEGIMFRGRTEAQAKENYGKDIEFVSENIINEAYLSNKKQTAILFEFPYGTLSGGIGPVGITRYVYCKVIIDCETKEILWTNNPGSSVFGAAGKNLNYEIAEFEFKNMANCKM